MRDVKIITANLISAGGNYINCFCCQKEPKLAPKEAALQRKA